MVAATPREIEGLRRANEATANLLRQLARRAWPGVTTGELDDDAAATIARLGGEAVFRTQNGFPGSINTSVNDEAVHGVPGGRVLRAGDLLSIDGGIGLGGYCGDAMVTIAVGGEATLSPRRRAVVRVAREALRRGIAAARVGGHVGDIGHAMQSYVEGAGFRLLPEYTGHGLGRRLWEWPSVPALGRPGEGARLVEGLVFTIEPIVVGGGEATTIDPDGWTVRTADGAPAAQFEHTVVMTRRGAAILSRRGPGRRLARGGGEGER